MKKNLILILIVSSFKLIAQHPDLPMVKWYAQTVTINGTSTNIPNNPLDFPTATIRFFSSGFVNSSNFQVDGFTAGNCAIGFTGNINYTTNNIFTFNDFNFIQENLVNCSNDLQNFMNLYISFYNDGVTEQFTYSITTETNGSKTLIVTNNNGNTINYTTNTTFLNSAPTILTNNIWILHNLIINGVDNTPPNNTELSEITLDFNGAVSTSACSGLIGYSYFFDYTLLQFYFYDISTDYGLTLCDTDYYENNAYTNLYIRDFYLNNLPGAFSYEHTVNGSTETLTITNALGNQAVYGNFTLSTQEFTNFIFSIYPNPVKDFLNIEVSNNEKIIQVSVYNLLGKKILTTAENNINLSKCENGIYFINILTENGNRITKKIIKIGA